MDASKVSSVQKDDFSEICRVCMSRSNNLSSLSARAEYTESAMCYSQLITTFTSVQICTDESQDPLPWQICDLCISQLKVCVGFRSKCENSDKTLREILQESASDSGSECDNDMNVEYLEIDEESQEVKRKSTTPIIKVCDISTLQDTSIVEKLKNEEEVLICHECRKEFTTKKRLVQHIQRVHTDEKRYECTYCGKMFNVNGNLKRHIMGHTGVRPHKCSHCSAEFIQRNQLAIHTRRHHTGEKPFSCSFCPRTFYASTVLKAHESKHGSGETQLKSGEDDLEGLLTSQSKSCAKCGREFSSTRGLYIHMQTHNLENVTCSYCKQSFRTEFHLKRHQCMFNKNQRFLCVKCGRKFQSQAILNTHLYSHSGQKPLACTFLGCDKHFRTQNLLRQHMLIHEGVKKHKCDICEKKFTQWSHLYYHSRLHTGVRPYTCRFCKKTFSMKTNYDCHVRRHLGDRKYECDECGQGFYDSSSRNKHKRRVHTFEQHIIEMTEDELILGALQ